MDADALKETRSTNATLVETIGKEYAVWDGMLAEMRSEEAAWPMRVFLFVPWAASRRS